MSASQVDHLLQRISARGIGIPRKESVPVFWVNCVGSSAQTRDHSCCCDRRGMGWAEKLVPHYVTTSGHDIFCVSLDSCHLWNSLFWFKCLIPCFRQYIKHALVCSTCQTFALPSRRGQYPPPPLFSLHLNLYLEWPRIVHK